jgi:N-acetylglucosamine kinase-like BadF-type ATPase
LVDGGPTVLAVDGGNSKTDLALVGPGGQLRAAMRGPTISHQAVGFAEGMARLARLAGEIGRAGRDDRVPSVGAFALAGADYPRDIRLLRRGIAAIGVVGEVLVVNDTLAALRAGTRRSWGIVLICGQGVNGAGVAPDGRVVRFDGVGDISGDWGGGMSLGMAAQAAAIRARDGRGPRTSLERLVPQFFGLRSPGAVARALYADRISHARLGELSPVVFAAAADGDAVARSIVDRLADELGVMAGALIRRLRLGRLDPDVVLAGGVFRTEEGGFHQRLAAGILAAAPAARIVRLETPPVFGAALLALEQLRGEPVPPDVAVRLEARLRAWAGTERWSNGPAGRASDRAPDPGADG